MKVYFDNNDVSSLRHHLRVAAETYDENAKQLATVREDSFMMTAKAASQLSEQFKRQAKEARRMMTQLDWAEDGIAFPVEVCEECNGNERKMMPCVCDEEE